MAKVTVAAYTTLRDKLGFSRMDFDGESLSEIISALCTLKKEIPNILMAGPGKVKSHFVLTLNSEIIDNAKINEVMVRDGDILHIFPPISGG